MLHPFKAVSGALFVASVLFACDEEAADPADENLGGLEAGTGADARPDRWVNYNDPTDAEVSVDTSSRARGTPDANDVPLDLTGQDAGYTADATRNGDATSEAGFQDAAPRGPTSAILPGGIYDIPMSCTTTHSPSGKTSTFTYVESVEAFDPARLSGLWTGWGAAPVSATVWFEPICGISGGAMSFNRSSAWTLHTTCQRVGPDDAASYARGLDVTATEMSLYLDYGDSHFPDNSPRWERRTKCLGKLQKLSSQTWVPRPSK